MAYAKGFTTRKLWAEVPKVDRKLHQKRCMRLIRLIMKRLGLQKEVWSETF